MFQQHDNQELLPLWNLWDFKLGVLTSMGFGVMLLTKLVGIKGILVISNCLATTILVSAVAGIQEALRNTKQDLLFVFKDIALSSSELELDDQIVMVEFIGAIFVCLLQISLSIIVLSERNEVQIWRQAWLTLHVPATFFTLYMLFSNPMALSPNPNYETFKNCILWNLVFSYLTLPTLISMDNTENRGIIYFSTPEIKI